jgi:hypothetical protein
MSAHRRIAEAGKRPIPASQPATEPVRFIASAPEADVMVDQLKYLAAHAVGSCPPGCADCARLLQVKNLLLLPFLSGRR